jgi:hypothetical protein
VRCLENELALWSRVSFDVQDDVTNTLPLPPGIGSVCEKEVPWKETVPVLVVVPPPPAGLNTMVHLGAFVELLPSPDAANFVQVMVTELQVALASPVCACALAVKIANERTTSAAMLRTRGTLTGPRPTRFAAGVGLWVIMLELLRAGVLSLLPVAEFNVTPRHGDAREESSSRWIVAGLGERRDWSPDAYVEREACCRLHAPPAEF